MKPYRLSAHYTRLRKAASAGDQSMAIAVLREVLGCNLTADVTTVGPDRCRTRLSYRGFKPAELAMLAGDLKPVVKFEDIPLPEARRFMRRHGDHYQLRLGTPYYKDYLLLRSRRTGLPDETPLTFIYASRGDAGERLRSLERQRPDAVEAAGALLGFPSCCAAAFAATFARSRQDQDALNDDAVYALLADTMRQPGRALLDPLSDHDLLAFYPCQPRCPRAVRFAERTLAALERSAPAAATEARATLGKPVLYWRMPFFIVLDGAPVSVDGPPAVAYKKAHIHIFPDPAVTRIQRLFGGLVLPLLDRGDQVSIEGGDVVVRLQDREVARLAGTSHRPPVLGLWHTR